MLMQMLNERFRLLESVADGPNGAVYTAVDTSKPESSDQDREILLTVMSGPFLRSADVFKSLQEYVHKLAGLDHPNLLRVLDCERDGQHVFMTTENFVGHSLEIALANRTNLEPRAIIRSVASGLEFAHRQGVVHGNLKPANVMVTANGQTVKLIGFDIPGWTEGPKTSTERREAAESRIVSTVTPQYASPQLLARQRPAITDDVYALACLTYRLLTGWHPFDDGTGIQTKQFPPPMRKGISSNEYAAVVSGLSLDRGTRTQTVQQFLDQLDAAENRRPPNRRLGWGVAATVAAVVLVAALYRHSVMDGVPPAPSPSVVAQKPPERPAFAHPASTPPKPGSAIRDCPTCLPLTVLAAGQFEQGAPSSDRHAQAFERPQHRVTIDKPFSMSTNDVTVGDFKAFAAASGRTFSGCDTYDGEWQMQAEASWQNPGFTQNDKHPVTCVSWNDAVAYAEWLSNETGHHYRLPSASEWEYAARAGATRSTPWGTDAKSACKNANVADKSAARRYPGWSVFPCEDGNIYTAAVGTYTTNAFGMNDMLGNVFVWTQDCWHGGYAGAPTDGSPRRDGDCSQHELRGGSWFSSPQYVTASYRNHFAADYRTSSVGIRLVRELFP